eukprot:CAMPEP_0206139874 /NCGR_PEP_ID=MMETSP1473-20131121/7614_1 /ASSEMBLY_ACC=CAM_ASM_001109 /TAXON_ID=1461547 /ORGANISM="Stichococcus sp, Strain RCC1054" /LENGTH=653 /DNA_ID=CAMNT_0053533801 /DNA_START=388 /DNA_END=2349 /DNA_ORIENTATION=-
MADMRAFQNCVYFLRGTCKNETNCPYKHDVAAAREYQAAAGGAPQSKAPASAVPEGHCFFFLKGPAGCAKGSACKFIHDEALKAKLTEERLSRPLPQATQPRPPVTRKAPHAAYNAANDSSGLVVRLDDPSPQAPAPMFTHQPPQHQGQHPRPQLHPHQQPQPGFPGGPAFGNGFQRHQQQQQQQPQQHPQNQHHQPRQLQQGVPQRGGAPMWGSAQSGRAMAQQGRDDGVRQQPPRTAVQEVQQDHRHHSRQPPPAIAAVVPSPEPARGRRSILDRLGPRVGGPPAEEEAPSHTETSPGTTRDAPRGRLALSSRIVEVERSERVREPERVRDVPERKRSAPSDESNGHRGRDRDRDGLASGRQPSSGQQQAPLTVTTPRTAAKRARLDQPLEPLRRPAAPASASRATAPEARQRAPLTALGALQGGRGERQAPRALSGSQPGGRLVAPKSREELRKEREAAAAGGAQSSAPSPQAAPSSQPKKQLIVFSQPAAAAAVKPVRAPVAKPAAAAAAATARAAPRASPQAAHAPQSAAAAQSAPSSAATASRAAASAAREAPAAAPAVKSPAAPAPVAVRAKAPAKASTVAKTTSAEFNFNVDSIDDGEAEEEELLDEDLEDALPDEGATPAGGAGAGGGGDDFDKELAEFENAFD